MICIVHSLNGQQGAILTNDKKANVSSFIDVCVKLLQMMS